MVGLGESAGFPCVNKLVAALVPVKNLGTANGVVACGYLFGLHDNDQDMDRFLGEALR